MEDYRVKEGFLCPVCIEDLGSIEQLQVHFDASHSQEDTDIKQAFFEFINRARSRLVRDVESSADNASSALTILPFIPYIYRLPHWDADNQPIGEVRSHLTAFRAIRDERTNHWTAHTNRLVLRLRRLTVDMPSDPLKRRTFEREVVAWADERSIDKCPDCGRDFSVLRRKHHCRVCGFIMCGRCSLHLPLSQAVELAADEADGALNLPQTDTLSSRSSTVAARTLDSLLSVGRRLRRSNSSDSLDSSVTDGLTANVEPQLRICGHCSQQLSRRLRRIQHTTGSTAIQQLYTRLCEQKNILVELTADYNSRLQLLLAGDSTSSLIDIRHLRARLLHIVSETDQLLKCMTLGEDDDSNIVRQLRQRISSAVSVFVQKEIMSNLEQLPSEEQLIELQRSRRLQRNEV